MTSCHFNTEHTVDHPPVEPQPSSVRAAYENFERTLSIRDRIELIQLLFDGLPETDRSQIRAWFTETLQNAA